MTEPSPSFISRATVKPPGPCRVSTPAHHGAADTWTQQPGGPGF